MLTATPIPRTYDLLLHGDLDVSLLQEMPPGRGEVKTHVRDGTAVEKIWAHLRERVTAGDRVYVVVPRLGEEVMDPADEASVKRTHEQLSEAMGKTKVALLHGKMKEEEKIGILEKFRKEGFPGLRRAVGRVGGRCLRPRRLGYVLRYRIIRVTVIDDDDFIEGRID